MIKLTRLDGEPFVLNADLIRYVERRPDTFVTLTSGDRIVVSESMDEVIQKAVEYQQQKHFMPIPSAPLPTTLREGMGAESAGSQTHASPPSEAV